MLDRIQRWLSIDAMLPATERLGICRYNKADVWQLFENSLACYITRFDATVYDSH